MKISVLIPVYNTGALLGKCLDSVLGQSYGNLEVVAVNDGSTDNTLEVLESYAARDGRLRVISQPNGGHQSARKAALENSTGELLFFLDSDDSMPSPTVLEHMAAAMTPEVQIVAGRMNIDNGTALRLFPSAVFDTLDMREYLCDYLLRGRVGWQLCAKLFRREVVLTSPTDLPKVRVGEDGMQTIAMVAASSGKAAMVDEPTYNYYMRTGSISHTRSANNVCDGFTVADYVENLLTGRVDAKYLTAFRLLCLSSSFRYGWLGGRHSLVCGVRERLRETPQAMRLIAPRKRLIVWLLLHFGDQLNKYVLKNNVAEN